MKKRQGAITVRGKEFKLVIIGDNVLFKHIEIPKKSEGGDFYEDVGYIYFSSKDKDSSSQQAVAFNAYDKHSLGKTLKDFDAPVGLVLSSSDTLEERGVLEDLASDGFSISLYKPSCDHENKEVQTEVHVGVGNKLEKLQEICKKVEVQLSDVLYIDNSLDPEKNKELIDSVGCVVCSKSSELAKVSTKDIIVRVNKKCCCGLIRDFFDSELRDGYLKRKSLDPTPTPLYNHRKKLKLAILDIDGTCTDNIKIYSADGNRLKRFNVDDVKSITELSNNGCRIAFVTGGKGDISKKFIHYISGISKKSFCEINAEAKEKWQWSLSGFKEKLKSKLSSCKVESIVLVTRSGEKKREIIESLIEELVINGSEVCYICDGLHDIEAAEYIIGNGGCVACPSSALAKVKEIDGIHIMKTPGGDGAAQEFTREIVLNNDRHYHAL